MGEIGTAARKNDGHLRRVSSLVAKAPPLLAAIFRWDRGGERQGTSGEGRAATTGEPATMTSGLLEGAWESNAVFNIGKEGRKPISTIPSFSAAGSSDSHPCALRNSGLTVAEEMKIARS
ncbi:hypothetical protein PIB30_007263 [Stylosanthes scabra]|uniref:Uncharacterized protein n=1 Tax=Stylosanthes scabra TaxID=79078 RepID=A0ABU6W425_9FABA|nr:hypothetical protein [Stylosanthes scabra]